MAAPVGPFILHPAAPYTPGGIKTIPLTLSSDVDLTDPAGQTGGYMARALLIGSTAGNVTYYGPTGDGPYTQAVAANQRLETLVSEIVIATTTAATISAII